MTITTTPVPDLGDDGLIARLRAAADDVPERPLDLDASLRTTKRHVRERRIGLSLAVTACLALGVGVAIPSTGASGGSAVVPGAGADVGRTGPDPVVVTPEGGTPLEGVTTPREVVMHRFSDRTALLETGLPTGAPGEQFVIPLQLVSDDISEHLESRVMRADDATIETMVATGSTGPWVSWSDPGLRFLGGGLSLVAEAGAKALVDQLTLASVFGEQLYAVDPLLHLPCYPLDGLGWDLPDGYPACFTAALVDSSAVATDAAAELGVSASLGDEYTLDPEQTVEP